MLADTEELISFAKYYNYVVVWNSLATTNTLNILQASSVRDPGIKKTRKQNNMAHWNIDEILLRQTTIMENL